MASAEERLRERALRLLSVRDRTRAELAERLRGDGVSDEAMEALFSWLERLGYLDERRFAENWVRARRSRYGPLRLEMELRDKGLDAHLAKEVVERWAGDEEAQEEAARALVRRRLTASSAADGREKARRRQRLTAMLLRRGFPAQVAARAVQRALGPEDPSPIR